MAGRVPPESPAQGESWDRVKANALAAGLCHACAAQLAWHLQEQSDSTRPPCHECAPIVATLPVDKGGGWRTVVGTSAHPRNWEKWRAGVDLVRTAGREAIPSTRGRSVPQKHLSVARELQERDR